VQFQRPALSHPARWQLWTTPEPLTLGYAWCPIWVTSAIMSNVARHGRGFLAGSAHLTGPGSRPPYFGYGLWVTSPAHFGERDRSLWGAGSLTLGSGIAHFGERDRSLWGAGSLTLGSGFFAGIPPKSLILDILSQAANPLDLLTLFLTRTTSTRSVMMVF
jgi:hypothetical protein